jgi:hypothetical protein
MQLCFTSEVQGKAVLIVSVKEVVNAYRDQFPAAYIK